MRVWSFQPKEVIETLLSKGEVYCKSTKVDNYAKPSYEWLIGKMIESGIEKPDGVEFPFWVWIKFSEKGNKPDLRNCRYNYPIGEIGYLLEFDIPEELIFKSDYGSWHSVMNYLPICSDEEFDKFLESDYWDKGWDAYPNELKNSIEETWLKIFEIENSDQIQGIVWSFRKEWLKKIVEFKGANKHTENFKD